jgi:hypothetical protein
VYQFLLSPEVKKSLLFISVLLCFCEVFGGARNSAVPKPAFVSQGEQGLYSALAANDSHHGFEINYRTVSASSNCRQQNGQSFIGTSEPVHYSSHKRFADTAEAFTQVSCKQYLAHIYPSHNFW